MNQSLILRQYQDGMVSLHIQGGAMIGTMPTVADAQYLLCRLGARRLDGTAAQADYVGGTWVYRLPDLP
jgi:hypothetical protein